MTNQIENLEQSDKHLNRSLTLFPTMAIVVGSVVGSGIFVSTASMARSLGSAPLMLGVWVLAGLMTLFGALTQCELVGQMPRTGGLYEYLREIYGESVGYLYGWANLVIAGSGAIAAISFVAASYLGEFVHLPRFSPELEKWAFTIPHLGTLFPLADAGTKLVGAVIIIFLTWLNIRGVKLGATLQSFSTTAKILAIFAVVAVAFIGGSHSHVGAVHNIFSRTAAGSSLSGWSLIGAVTMALSGAFWCYDGWGNIAYIGGEVREPTRTIPRAIILGTFGFIALYLVVNVAYLYILPIDAIGKVTDDRVASQVVSSVMGGVGGSLVAVLIMLSSFDTTNSTILTNGRVYYAMAHEGAFWSRAGAVHSKYKTPHIALMIQAFWALLLILTGSFDLITSMYVFVNWALYALMALGVFILRKRNPHAHRPFKTPGYPFIPGAFVLFSVTYVFVTLVTDIQAYQAGSQPIIKSLAGVALVLTGLPFYIIWKRSNLALFSAARK